MTSPAPPAAEPSATDTSRIIFLLSAAAFCSAATMRVTDTLLPVFEREFGISLGLAAQTITVFAVGYGLMQIVFGPVGDRYGKLRTIGWACIGCAVANVLCAAAPGFSSLVVARGVAGAMAAALIPLSMAWIGDQVPYAQRQAVLARFLTGQILGFASGQVLGGVAGDYIGWRAGFALLAVLFLLAAVALLPHRRRDDVHLAGPGLSLWRGLAGVVSRPWARRVLLLVAVEGALVFGGFAFIASHLHLQFGLSLSVAGAILAGYAGGGLVYALAAPWFVRRFGERGLSAVGGALLGAAMLTVALTPWWPLAVPACLLAGLGFYMLHNTLQIHATQMAPQRGAAVSLFASMLFLGQSAGVFVASRVIEWVGPAHGTMVAIAFTGVALPVLGWAFSRALQRHAGGGATDTTA